MYPVPVAKAFAKKRNKTVVVGTREVDVHVIVPRNESLVPTRPKRRTAAKHVYQTVLAAYGINVRNDPGEDDLKPPKVDIGDFDGLAGLYMLESVKG
jgi:hypothetical protein